MPQVKGHYGDWRECSDEEAASYAELFYRDFPDNETNREIFENHVRGLDFEKWISNRT